MFTDLYDVVRALVRAEAKSGGLDEYTTGALHDVLDQVDPKIAEQIKAAEAKAKADAAELEEFRAFRQYRSQLASEAPAAQAPAADAAPAAPPVVASGGTVEAPVPSAPIVSNPTVEG